MYEGKLLLFLKGSLNSLNQFTPKINQHIYSTSYFYMINMMYWYAISQIAILFLNKWTTEQSSINIFLIPTSDY